VFGSSVSSSRTADNTASSLSSVAKVSSLTTINGHRRRHYFGIYVSENGRYISITLVLHSEKVDIATRLSVVNSFWTNGCANRQPIRGSRFAENRGGLLWNFRGAIGGRPLDMLIDTKLMYMNHVSKSKRDRRRSKSQGQLPDDALRWWLIQGKWNCNLLHVYLTANRVDDYLRQP